MKCKILNVNYDDNKIAITLALPGLPEPFVIEETASEFVEGNYARRILKDISSTLSVNLADIRRIVEGD